MYTLGQVVDIMFNIEGRLVSSSISFQGRAWTSPDGEVFGEWKNENNGNTFWFTADAVSDMVMSDSEIEQVESY